METPGHSVCPACGSGELHWHVERTGRRGQPLRARSIVWSCASCETRLGADAAAPGAPPTDLGSA